MAKTTTKSRIMTEGSIWKHLLFFAIPLLIGNLFQQLYNTVDSIVVGNFVGKEALAAVGTTDSIINTIIGFFMGMSTGAGVIISHYFGAKNDEGVHKAVHTTIAITIIMSVVFSILGVLLVPAMLHLMKTSALGQDYLRHPFPLLSQEQYVDTVVRQLEVLRPEIIIQRLTGDGVASELIAPQWTVKKTIVLNEIDKQMARENTWQGKALRHG